jgi:general stress protein YciG
MEKSEAEVSVREAGRRGGIKTRDRYGLDFYREIGSKGGQSTKKRYANIFAEIGKLGGRPNRK